MSFSNKTRLVIHGVIITLVLFWTLVKGGIRQLDIFLKFLDQKLFGVEDDFTTLFRGGK